jgi:hypothetical protein
VNFEMVLIWSNIAPYILGKTTLLMGKNAKIINIYATNVHLFSLKKSRTSGLNSILIILLYYFVEN